MDAQYLRARYYSPGTADFLTEASHLGNLRDPLTLNRYSYVKSSPLNYVDPSGNIFQIVIGAIIGGTVSGVSNYLMQKLSGNTTINKRELWTNVLAGTISGALGGTELKKTSLAIMNAMISGVTYWQSREANQEQINVIDLLVAVSAGTLTGYLGGNAKDTNIEIFSYKDVLNWMQTWGYMSYFDTLKSEMTHFMYRAGFNNFITTVANSGISNLWDLIKLAKSKIETFFCQKDNVSEELDYVADYYTVVSSNL